MKNTLKVIIFIGTRPEAIKLAPVIEQLKALEQCCVTVCSTGQHKTMLQQVLTQFNITVDFSFDVMTENQTLNALSSIMLGQIDELLQSEQPDWVIVQGDTTTAMIAALASFNRGVKVAHVEAGLRSGNMHSPWPEEGNRRLITAVASHHFAPTQAAKLALESENIQQSMITVTGNTVIDALMKTCQNLSDSRSVKHHFDQRYQFLDQQKRLILVTGHRRENWGDVQRDLFVTLKRIVQEFGVEIIYPVHLNPNVTKNATSILGDTPGVHLIEPVEYSELVYLMQRCYLIITDSGGIQEEAPSLGKPVLVTRSETERKEGIVSGSAILVGTDSSVLIDNTSRLLNDSLFYQRCSDVKNPYGDGHASKRIADFMKQLIEQKELVGGVA